MSRMTIPPWVFQDVRRKAHCTEQIWHVLASYISVIAYLISSLSLIGEVPYIIREPLPLETALILLVIVTLLFVLSLLTEKFYERTSRESPKNIEALLICLEHAKATIGIHALTMASIITVIIVLIPDNNTRIYATLALSVYLLPALLWPVISHYESFVRFQVAQFQGAAPPARTS